MKVKVFPTVVGIAKFYGDTPLRLPSFFVELGWQEIHRLHTA